MASDEITNDVLLEHIQAYGLRFDSIDARFDQLEKKLEDKIDGVEKRLTNRIDGLSRNLNMQLDNIDERVQDIEINQLPAIKQHVGIA